MPKPGPGNGTLPVTYIGFAEAKAYCNSMGKRLPTSVEWQFAGQGSSNGTDGEAMPYPWGQMDNAALRPNMTTGNIFRGPEPVGRYSPAGDSLFGLQDLVGNVRLQSNFSYACFLSYATMSDLVTGRRFGNIHLSMLTAVSAARNALQERFSTQCELMHRCLPADTRSVILRGGANYRPSGSGWYLPDSLRGGRSLTPTFAEHEKYFLMDDRCESLTTDSRFVSVSHNS